MKTKSILFIAFIYLGSWINAQTTVVLQNGEDSFVHSLPSYMNANFGENQQLTANAWTFSGEPGVVRGLLKYDISFIPEGATIESATLNLFAIDSNAGFGQHSPYSGSNACWVNRVTSEWDEFTVTWNSQPSYSTENQAELSMSASPTQNYEVDVKNIVQDMVDNPISSYGFLLKLKNESYYRRMNFASSDHANDELHPTLNIVYSESDCITLQPDAIEGKDAILHGLFSYTNTNYGDNPQFVANAWTFSGREGVVRSVIDFDLSAIPSGATINSAKLSLFAWDSNGGFEQHSTLSGSNACSLQRIISEWEESKVTWDTQPDVTSSNQVQIPMSSFPTQDYLDIDVLDLVQDMIDNPSESFGFMLKLQNENFYRRMNFCSSDHPNSDLRPKLEICYSLILHSDPEENINFELFPNPTKDLVYINIDGILGDNNSMAIFNGQGQLIKKFEQVQLKNSLNVSSLSAGLYYVMLEKDGEVLTKKFIVR